MHSVEGMLRSINRKLGRYPVALLAVLMLLLGLMATEGSVYLLATFVFTDLPIARALGITFVVTLVVAIPQLVLGGSAVTSIRRSRNELRPVESRRHCVTVRPCFA